MNEGRIADFLRHAGIQPSGQRIAVFSYLDEKKNHPTVDTVYSALSPSMPALSRTTVYNTMKIFVSHGVVRPVMIEDGEMRYDADVSVHGHFKCRCCGEVFDIFYDRPEHVPGAGKDYEVDETHIYYLGRCPGCRQKSGEKILL